MSEEKQYLGMVWHDGRLIYNCAPREHQTIHLAPVQIIPLLKSLESCLEADPLSKPSTDLVSWLEGYQDGFSASHLLKTEVCNRCSSQPSGLSTQNLSSSSPSSASKDARTDSTSEAGNETVAQDTQAKRPHDDTLSEQERCDRVNLAVQTDIRKYREERLTSPTDEELQKWGCPKLLDPRARMFICQLPDEDLRTIRRHAMPGWLAGLLSQIADEEIERRAGEDEASS
ncbi:hypothetical protein [Saccharibacter floricola]|uniref:Uncharacterized protein n=1 Tax=Saccharibacter floricola DSM 15669 TaxID=1123227 RepID=A0ABQ0P1I4_9PROT|nr:hypothetical protein [Saccharibacter floricola]GBQ09075.1 hypothetical protein AA15669_2047 [Saccharibacter floricola DSM 15669]